MRNVDASVPAQVTPDLNFTEAAHRSATHMLHPYAARCPPPLARWAISTYSLPGEVVLDPMAGSGTTLVEACLLGRRARGADIDPLARLIARVKTTPVALDELGRAVGQLGVLLADNALDDGWRPDLPQFDKWFNPEVARDLGAIRAAINALGCSKSVTDLLWVAFSSLIVARTSVANARDLVHSRHHHRPWANDPQTRARFLKKIAQFDRCMTAYQEILERSGHPAVDVTVDGSDARALPIVDGAVDLVFTSPPYCSALDYTRAHMFAVVWMPEVLGTDERGYRLLARQYVGTERAPLIDRTPEQPLSPHLGLSKIDDVVDALGDHAEKAWIVHRYFRDMRSILHEAFRVLRPGGHLVLVVCPSNIRKVTIATPDLLAEVICSLELGDGGPEVVALYERTIHDRRRVMPYLESRFGSRMRTEYVLIARLREDTGARSVTRVVRA